MSGRPKPHPDAFIAELRRLFAYDRETATFVRLVKKGPNKVGAVAGTINAYGYKVIKIDGRNHLLHRLVWLLETGDWPKADIDHIDRNKLNNHISNLRDVSRSVNQQNRVKALRNNPTGMLGVSFHKSSNSYRAIIGLNNKQIHIGHFDNPEDARKAYLAAKRKYHVQEWEIVF